MPYDRAVVIQPADQAAVAGSMAGTTPPRHRRTRAPAAPGPRSPRRPVPSDPWLTGLAFAVVGVPFAIALVRLATASTAHLALPDDLALIDLHVRRALVWKQQLGVFDHNNWNHPGPAYFYLVSLVYRLLGSSERSLFVGATLLNGLAATACVAVVRRRTTAARTLWAAVWVAVLVAVLAAAGPAVTTYSESVLGALVSPWNPTVVLVPLLLLVLLCAGAVDRSATSLVGALAVGTYVVQTDISTGPLVVALVGGAGVTWVVTAVVDRRARTAVTSATGDGPDGSPAAASGSSGRGGRGGRATALVLVLAGSAAVVLMWLPPFVQQVTNHPGNVTLIARFYGDGHPGQTLSGSMWAVAAGMGVLLVGPSEVMTTILGGTPAHAGPVVAVSLATVGLAVVTAVAGVRRRARFAAGMGALTVIGCAAALVAVTHVVGFVFGYLVIWAVVLPVAALIGIGTVRVPVVRAGTGLRVALCAAAVVAGAVACARVAAIPPLARAGDPNVARLAALVAPRIPAGGRVAVGDAGAGTHATQLLDTEEFIGLVNALDRAGFRPTVNAFWKAQFGPGYLADGTEPSRVTLATWTPGAESAPGYVGRVGDMAVLVTDRGGGAAAG